MAMLESVDSRCPYCGAPIALLIDRSVSRQQYVEDCAVCCQPMVVSVVVPGSGGEPRVSVKRQDD